jgi:hypothetical protein
MIVGAFYWSLIMAGIFFPFFHPLFVDLGLTGPGQVAIGLLILFISVFILILFIGYVYDKVFKMWAEQKIVIVERNIYLHTKQSAKEIVHFQYHHIPLLRGLGLQAEGDFFNKWNERCMEEDKVLRDDVYKIARWSNEYTLRPKKDRWLKDIRKDIDKKLKVNAK